MNTKHEGGMAEYPAKSLLRSFWRSFSCSTDSTTVTARLRLTKFAVPIEPKRTARYAQEVSNLSRAKKDGLDVQVS